jgi:hypothetical protein
MEINYYQMHYHMKQCGIRTVIEDIFQSLSKNKNFNLNLIYSAKKGKFVSNGYSINNIDIPEVDYEDYIFLNKKALMEVAQGLKEKIKKKLDLSKPCVLHCHNVNLFKNSYLSAALMLLAKDLEEMNFVILYQVHDFAEEKRPNRLHLLLNCSGKKDRLFGSKITYPIGKNIFYTTINSRDSILLNKLGIPKKHISIFHNAIDTDVFQSKPKYLTQLKKNIAEYAKNNNYIFDYKRKILLSPLKLIQRKNIAETILILKMLNKYKDEWQLLITLEGSSPDDVRYGDKIKEYIRINNLPVTIGFGYKLLSKEQYREKFKNNITDIYAISDAVITTSTQEGFGFCYVEGWVANKKVIGRRLDYIFKDFEKNGLNFNHFYNKISVGKVDFCNLDIDSKLKYLDKIDYNVLLKNSEFNKTIDLLYNKTQKIVNHNKKIILKHYSKESYERRLKLIIDEVMKIKNSKLKFVKPKIDNLPIIKFFKSQE